MDPNPVTGAFKEPVFDPAFVNLDYIFAEILEFFRSPWPSVEPILNVLHIVGYILALFGITLIIYCLVRMVEIANEEEQHLRHAIHDYADKYAEEDAVSGKNARWEHIQELVGSPNPSDWRLAVMEADTVFEGLLDARDIPGTGIGEKLKNMSPGDLSSIQAAWEAHLVRNRIAHEGSQFELSQRDARRAVQLFEVVFREMGFI